MADWVARQLTEAFPWDEAPRHLIRDRDRIYGSVVTRRLRAMGIRDKPTAPASPWQNGFAERLIGSIRRECVDHIIVLGEVHLRQILQSYARYYNDIRTHRSLDKDAPGTERRREGQFHGFLVTDDAPTAPTARSCQPAIESTPRDTERPAQPLCRPNPPVLRNKTELHVDSFAK